PPALSSTISLVWRPGNCARISSTDRSAAALWPSAITSFVMSHLSENIDAIAHRVFNIPARDRRACPQTLLGLQARHIDHESVFDVGADQPRVRLVHLLDRDHLHIRGDVVLSAEIKHL